MSNFEPGKIIKEFKTKSGKNAVVRYFNWQDLDEMTDYINELAEEDTFVAVSPGETTSKKEEADFLINIFKQMEFQLGSTVGCFIELKMAGITGVNIRNGGKRQRIKHQADLGMSVRKEFRGDGLGSALMEVIVAEAKTLPGVKLVRLSVMANNPTAIKLYEKFGFKNHGEIPKSIFYKNDYVSEIEMSLDLS